MQRAEMPRQDFYYDGPVIAPSACLPERGQLTIGPHRFEYGDVVDDMIAVSKDSPEDRQRLIGWARDLLKTDPGRTVIMINSRFGPEDAGPIEPLELPEASSFLLGWCEYLEAMQMAVLASLMLDPEYFVDSKYFAPKEGTVKAELDTATGADLDTIGKQMGVERLTINGRALPDSDFRNQLRRESRLPNRANLVAEDLLDVLEVMPGNNVIVLVSNDHLSGIIQNEVGHRAMAREYGKKAGIVRRYRMGSHVDAAELRRYRFDAVVDCRADGPGEMPEVVSARLTPCYTSVAWRNGKWDVRAHVGESNTDKLLRLVSKEMTKYGEPEPVNLVIEVFEIRAPAAEQHLADLAEVVVRHDDARWVAAEPPHRTRVVVKRHDMVNEGIDPMVALREFAAKNPINELGDKTPVDHGKRFMMGGEVRDYADDAKLEPKHGWAEIMKSEVERTHSDIGAFIADLLRRYPDAPVDYIQSHLINFVPSNGMRISHVRVHSPDGTNSLVAEVDCVVQVAVQRIDFAIPTEGQRLADFFARSEHDGHEAVMYQKPKGPSLPDDKEINIEIDGVKWQVDVDYIPLGGQVGTHCGPCASIHASSGVGDVHAVAHAHGIYCASTGVRFTQIDPGLAPIFDDAQGALRHYEKESGVAGLAWRRRSVLVDDPSK